MTFAGTYADAHGAEQVEWRVAPSGVFELVIDIRGVTLRGDNFESLVPDDVAAAKKAGLSLDSWNDLTDCTLGGEVPCLIERGGIRVPVVLCFEVRPAQSIAVNVSVRADGSVPTASGDTFETALEGLGLPEGDRLVTCFTCLFSDYSPAGQNSVGMRCHRDTREQYLQVRSKADYWAVPLTENVPDFYLCPEYESRTRGTGYRG